MLLFWVLFFCLTTTASARSEVTQCSWAVPGAPIEQLSGDDFVDLQEFIPQIEVELKYATTDNITGRCIYNFDRAYLRLNTAIKLRNAQAEAEKLGYKIKVWDAYRPPQTQFLLWEACPNPNYIANPNTTFSYHSRGSAVDVTLTDAQGNELSMPSQFDDSTNKASRYYADDAPDAAAHARLLERIMYDSGFTGLQSEWWHYQDSSGPYPVASLNTPQTVTVANHGCIANVAVYILNGRMLAPVRCLAEPLNLEVNWDGVNQQVTLEGMDKRVILKPGSNLVKINGSAMMIETAPHIIGGVTFVPVRTLCDWFGHDVVWDGAINSLFID